MKRLLDSHALIWAVDDPSKLGSLALPELQNGANELLVSAATIWELSIKCGLGKLTLSMPYRAWMEKALTDLGGVKRGFIYGASDKFGARPDRNPVRPEDLAATMFHLLGIDPGTEVFDTQNRPLTIATGNPITGVYA